MARRTLTFQCESLIRTNHFRCRARDEMQRANRFRRFAKSANWLTATDSPQKAGAAKSWGSTVFTRLHCPLGDAIVHWGFSMSHELFTVGLAGLVAVVVGSILFRFLVLPWVYRALDSE